MEHFDAVRDLMALTLELPPESITVDTVQESCPQWDSLRHLNLMLALEDTFQVALTVEEIGQLTSVAAILAYLRDRGA